MTPFLIAAKFCKLQLVPKLIKLGGSTRDRDAEGNSAMSFLAEYNICDRTLFANFDKETINIESEADISHFFYFACKFCPKTIEIVENYLKQGILPNFQMIGGTTPLHMAVGIIQATPGKFHLVRSFPKLVRQLLDYGAGINQKNSHRISIVEMYRFFIGIQRGNYLTIL